MNLPQPLQQASFSRRLNRFAAEIETDGTTALAHVPNSGRLGELLVPGAQVHVYHVTGEKRRTSHDLLLVRHGRVLVSIDSRAPTPLAAEAIAAGAFDTLCGPLEVRTEVRLGDSRIDILGVDAAGGREWFIETKGCTLVRKGTAIFPDAPTARGRRHVEELTRYVRSGGGAMVLFVVQRYDAHEFRPNSETDPGLCEALLSARDAGVLIEARRCRVSRRRVTLAESLPVILDEPLPPRLREAAQCA